MLFNPNDTLLLGQEKYRIIRFLGGGAVGDVYLATWMGIEPVEVIIKLLRDDYRNIPLLEDREKLLQAVQAEIDTLNHLNAKEDSHWKQITSVSSKILRARETRLNRKVIALFDSGVIEDYPYLVQELAPPEFQRFDVLDINSELKMLRVALALAQVVQLAHSNGIALKDFEPNTKGDRIRGIWLENNELDFKLIDWNINGSTPDELKLDLVYLGCHLYRFFVGEYLPYGDVQGSLPENLDIYPAWNNNLNEGTRLILQGLLSNVSIELYSNIDLVVEDLFWWADVLACIVSPENPIQYISTQIRLASDGRQFRRMLALAHLALEKFQKTLNDSERKKFEDQIDFAKKKIEEKWRLVTVNAHQAYLMQYYDKAVQEYQQRIKELPPQYSLTKEACLEMLFAQTRSNLSKKTDLSLSNEIEKGIVELFLLGDNWEDALIALAKLPQFDSVELMKKWAIFEISLTESKKRLMNPSKGTNTETEWLDFEQQQIENIDQFLTKSKELAVGLEFLPWIPGELNAVQIIYTQRCNRKGLIDEITKNVLAVQQTIIELNAVARESPSVEITNPTIVRIIESAKKLFKNIDDLLRKCSQLRLTKDLEEQLWLIEKTDIFLSQQNHVAEMIKTLEERQKSFSEWISVKPHILALIDKNECQQASQLLHPFEDNPIEVNELVEISQRIKKCNDELEEDWIRLRKAFFFLQPINGPRREFSAAKEQLEGIREQMPAGLVQVRILLVSFIENIFPGYYLVTHEPSADNLEACLNFISRLEHTIQDTARQWEDINLEWGDNLEWKLLDDEKKWVANVNGMMICLTTQKEREDVWRYAIKHIDDCIKEKPASGGRKEYVLELSQADFDEWDVEFPLAPPFPLKTWKKFPDNYIIYFLILYLGFDKKQLKITKDFHKNTSQKLAGVYLNLLLNKPLTLNELTNLDVVIADSAKILDKASYNDLKNEWEDHRQKYGEFLYRIQRLRIPNLLDGADDTLILLNSFETSKFNVLFANVLQNYGDNAKDIFEEQMKALAGQLDAFDIRILKALQEELEGWKAWLAKYGVDLDVEWFIMLAEDVSLKYQRELERRKMEQEFAQVKNNVFSVLSGLENDTARTFAQAAQDTENVFAKFLGKYPSQESSDEIRGGVHEMEEIVRELSKVADLEYIANNLPARQGSDYHQVIKKLTDASREIQILDILKRKIPGRLNQFGQIFESAIKDQVGDLLYDLETGSKYPENSDIKLSDLFKSANAIADLAEKHSKNFEQQITLYWNDALKLLLKRLYEEALPDFDMNRSAKVLDSFAQLASLKFIGKESLFYDLIDAIQRGLERKVRNKASTFENGVINQDRIMLGELVSEAGKFSKEWGDVYQLGENWLSNSSVLGELILKNTDKTMAMDKLSRIVSDLSINTEIQDNFPAGRTNPVQTLQFLNKMQKEFTESSSRHLDVNNFARDWDIELKDQLSKIKDNEVKERILVDYAALCKIPSGRTENLCEYFIFPVEDEKTYREVISILDVVWKKNSNLFNAIINVIDFKKALHSCDHKQIDRDWKRFGWHLSLWPLWLPFGWLRNHWIAITFEPSGGLRSHWKIIGFIAFVLVIVAVCCILTVAPATTLWNMIIRKFSH